MAQFVIERLVQAPKDVVWAVVSDVVGYAEIAPNLSKAVIEVRRHRHLAGKRRSQTQLCPYLCGAAGQLGGSDYGADGNGRARLTQQEIQHETAHTSKLALSGKRHHLAHPSSRCCIPLLALFVLPGSVRGFYKVVGQSGGDFYGYGRNLLELKFYTVDKIDTLFMAGDVYPGHRKRPL
jgi:hypothetical protein